MNMHDYMAQIPPPDRCSGCVNDERITNKDGHVRYRCLKAVPRHEECGWFLPKKPAQEQQ